MRRRGRGLSRITPSCGHAAPLRRAGISPCRRRGRPRGRGERSPPPPQAAVSPWSGPSSLSHNLLVDLRDLHLITLRADGPPLVRLAFGGAAVWARFFKRIGKV